MMKAHINVELCSSDFAEYTLKYINKGSDQTMFSIEIKNNDKIDQNDT